MDNMLHLNRNIVIKIKNYLFDSIINTMKMRNDKKCEEYLHSS